ncbi:MAG: hypothetical protein HQ562_11370 [Candidatus Marinimicrobia bacterium]|nr:hypothetical protein [Candidatus Neomarinimicrobiota bacterium]
MKQIKMLMKLLLLCTMAVALVYVAGCSDTATEPTSEVVALSTAPTPVNKELLPNPYDWVGEAHNDGMDYMYTNLAEMEFTAENIEDKTESLIRDYLTDNGYILEGLDAVKMGMNIGRHEVIIKREGSRWDSVLDSVIENSDLLEKQKYYLSQISQLIDDQLPLEALDFALKEINTSAAVEELSEVDLAVILTASSVAFSSSKCWHEMSAKWENMLKSKLDIPGFTLDKWVKADIAGAIAGGIVGGALGGLPGAGTGAVIAGTTASLASLINEVLDYYF